MTVIFHPPLDHKFAELDTVCRVREVMHCKIGPRPCCNKIARTCRSGGTVSGDSSRAAHLDDVHASSPEVELTIGFDELSDKILFSPARILRALTTVVGRKSLERAPRRALPTP
jgi:hypothetical protein